MVKNVKKKYGIILGSYVLLEVALLLLVFTGFSPLVSSGAGGTVVVKTSLDVGAVYPEVLNISINDGANVILTANSTKTVVCQALVQDWNNDTDIWKVNATLYDVSASTWNGAEDNNDHYSNATCVIDPDTHGAFGKIEDEYHALANCSFEVEYYANPGTWNCSVYVEDSTNRSNREEDSGVIDSLLAVGLPESVNYGIVNSTDVSDEQSIPVENVGNVQLNLTLEGYAQTEDDGFAMNCSKGSSPFIDIMYEKFNLTASNLGILSLSETEASYLNLTNTPSNPDALIKDFGLPARTDDLDRSGAIKPTYWRIYVPKGLAGTCEGNIVFGATSAPGN